MSTGGLQQIFYPASNQRMKSSRDPGFPHLKKELVSQDTVKRRNETLHQVAFRKIINCLNVLVTLSC